MIVKTDKLMFIISFKHTRLAQRKKGVRLTAKEKRERAQTACKVESLIPSPMCPKHEYKSGTACMCQPVHSATGVAVCNPVDQYNKETGRRVALTRALDSIAPEHGADRHNRAVIWNAYLTRPRGNEAAAVQEQT